MLDRDQALLVKIQSLFNCEPLIKVEIVVFTPFPPGPHPVRGQGQKLMMF
jgi:hypothetical protein